jgi:hypothetical protein
MTVAATAREKLRSFGPLRVAWMAARSRSPVRNSLALRRNARFARYLPYTLLSYDRLADTERLAEACVEAGQEGAFVECGVWKGGVAALLGSVARREGKGRVTHGFDSFQGLPQPTREDGHQGDGRALRADGEGLAPTGLYAAGREGVERVLFDVFGLSKNAVRLHEGWFQDTLPSAAASIGTIALLRIDADWYDSVRCCLDALYDRVARGGYVILDDYGGYPGCKRAWDEFAAERHIDARLHVSDGYGVWMRKP